MKNLISKSINYFQTSYAELKKVVWPSRKEVINHTLIIALSVLIALIVIGLFDFGFGELVQLLVLE